VRFKWREVFKGEYVVRSDEVTGEWRKLHNEELSDLYLLRNIVREVESRKMRWAGHVARIGRGEGCKGFWWGNLRERDHWEDPDADWWIILRWIFRIWEEVVGNGWSWLRIETGEYGDEHSGSKSAGNFLTSCRTSYLLKKDSAPWSK